MEICLWSILFLTSSVYFFASLPPYFATPNSVVVISPIESSTGQALFRQRGLGTEWAGTRPLPAIPGWWQRRPEKSQEGPRPQLRACYQWPRAWTGLEGTHDQKHCNPCVLWPPLCGHQDIHSTRLRRFFSHSTPMRPGFDCGKPQTDLSAGTAWRERTYIHAWVPYF